MGEAMLGGKSEVSVSRIGRRSFLRSLAADATLLAAKADSTIYEVGVGWGTHPYWTTLRAVAATGQWPAARIAGHTVVIKTNLVSPKPSTSGATTDPQVVRALVDMALYAGASQVQIVEASLLGKVPRWAACGYTFFHTYNPRVSLVDLTPGAYNYTPVLNGYAYQYMYVSSLVVDPNIVFISAAKLKTHVNAVATLSMKNLFGLADQTRYHVPNHLARQDCHSRGVDLTIMDLNLIRPIHFAVIDGIWGMEGQGPIAEPPSRQMSYWLAPIQLP